MTREIKLPEKLFNRIEKVADKLGVDDINDFIIDLLREAISRYEAELSEDSIEPEELDKIRDRLRSLGYLD